MLAERASQANVKQKKNVKRNSKTNFKVNCDNIPAKKQQQYCLLRAFGRQHVQLQYINNIITKNWLQSVNFYSARCYKFA